MRKRWRSLRFKIIAWSFVPTVIILSAVAWFTFFSYQKVLGDLAIKQDWAVVQSNAVKFNLAIGNLVNPIVLPIILDIDIHKEDPIEVRAQNILDQAKYLDVFDGGIYFLDQQGKVFRTWPEKPGALGQDWSGTPDMQFIQANPGRAAFTDLRPAAPTSEQQVVCLAQSMNGPQAEFIGAYYFCFVVYPPGQTTLNAVWARLGLGQGVFIMDGNQRILYSADPSLLGKDVSGEAYIQQLLQNENSSFRFRNGADHQVISFYPVDSKVNDRNRWILIKEQSWSEIMQPSRPYQQLLLVLLALGVIVPVLVTAYGVRHLTQPIQKLLNAAENVTAGQFKHQIEVKTGDEIETLADQFNLMSAELDESYASLEKKVADRTRELAVMNSVITVASHSLDIHAIIEDALNTTVEQMGFSAGAAFRFETETTAVLLTVQKDLDPDIATDLVKRYALTSQRDPVYPDEVTTIGVKDFQDETIKNDISRLGFQRLVYVPLSTKGRELGFFILGKQSEPTSEELALLSAIGKQIGVAMENAHLYEQAEQTAILSERNRLARELHDAVTQTLFSASIVADVTPQIWKEDPEEGLQHLEELRQLTRGALAEMRTLLLEMRPGSLQRADIKSLLTQLAEAFIGRVRIPLALQICGECALAQDVKIVYYRVAQEALNNIAKHSGARQVVLRLDCQPGHLYLCIQDDGLGFDIDSIPPGHLGVGIMRERAGSIGASLKIESQPGRGTIVEMDWTPA